MLSANEIMRRRAGDTVRALLALAPRGSIRAAFVGGSVARDEVASTRNGETLVIHSDIDLYVILDAIEHAPAVRAAAAQAVASLPHQQDGAVFTRSVEIGIYQWEDLLAQPVRPGTVDLGEHHVWLHGDASLMREVARALDRPMRAEEALYLLENRAWDAYDARHDANLEGRWQRRTQAAKWVMDIGAAHLIAEGRFAATRAERLSRLRSQRPSLMSLRAMEAIEAVARENESADASPLDDLEHVRALLAEAWVALAPAICGPAGAKEVATLLAKRCKNGALIDNYRELVHMRRRARLNMWGALGAGWRLANLSPQAALRTHALARTLIESGHANANALDFHTAYVARLTQRLGFGDGSQDERARAAWRALA